MNDSTYISRPLVIAFAAWTVTFTLAVAAWVVNIISASLWHWSALLGLTACMFSAVASVLHVKAHLVRVCNLVRNASGLSEARDIRAVR